MSIVAEKKEKRYVSDNAQLMAEWDWEKNTKVGFDPTKLTCGSGRKAWWRCSKGHEWQATIDSRSRGNGCPFCAGQRLIQGYNDLQTANPTLAAEWNYNKNGEIKPENTMANSVKKVWWVCNKGHEWQAKIDNRNRGAGCPYCSGRYAIPGKNDLETANPTIANEWNYEKNFGITPTDVKSSSGKKVWWKCNKGHEWQATIAHRNNGTGCPVCNAESKTSFPEYALIFYLKQCGLEPIHSYKGRGYELDVYIPSLNIAIEYDGGLWHRDRIIQDLEKNQKCERDGIKLFRLRENLMPLNDSSIDFVLQAKQRDLSKVIKAVLNNITNVQVDVDTERDSVAIDNLREFIEKNNSLLLCNSKLSAEWNYEKNGNLKPENYAGNSHKKVWWVCNKGHEWQSTIASRNHGSGCPYCAGKMVLRGYNDLQTINPSLAQEWDYEKNENLKPDDFTAGSGKKVWWKCSEGHNWQAAIYNRNNGRGCPICAKKK